MKTLSNSATVQKHPLFLPKRRVDVRVELLNGNTMSGSFYADRNNRSGGPGRVSDRLNSDSEPFLPLAVEDGHILVRKAVIATVQMDDEPWETPQPAPNTTELQLRVKLMNGSTTSGTVVAVLPKGSRALDYLNTNDAGFFALIAADSKIVLVNARHVESVIEFIEPLV